MDAGGQLLSGDRPTKEGPLHRALYETRHAAGAVVHLHSTHAVAVSMLPEIEPGSVLPPLTAYYVMRVGDTALVPYHRPGNPAVADAIRGLAGRYASVLLANHGPVMAGDTLAAAVNAIEELEETAKLYLLLRGPQPAPPVPRPGRGARAGLRRPAAGAPPRGAVTTGPRIPGARAVPGAATLRHVADRAGVSPITVSRALNKPALVSGALRDRVRRAVDELGYVQNRVAGALASAETRVVPVVVPSLSNAVFVETVQGIQEVVQRAGFQLLLGNTEYDLDREHGWISTFLGWSPPGLIVAGTRHQPRTRALLERWGRPVVEIMEVGSRPIDMNVGLSHAAAGAAMARHLLARGHADLLFAGCRLAEDYRAGQRFRGFDRALASAGAARRPPLTRDVPSSPALGGDMLVAALRLDPPPGAIFYANDDLAVGAILRAQRDGIAVPGRVAVAGFNGLDISGLVTPGLTTIVSPRRDIGRIGAEKLLGAIAGGAAGARRVDVGFTLVERGST